jgi:hypothetical protein
MERIMKTIQSVVVSAALAIAMAAPAPAAQSDPEVILYRFPGVRDNGGAANTGVATSFSCTNFSGATENIRFVTRDFDGFFRTNVTFFMNHLDTATVSTHQTNAYVEIITLDTGAIARGSTAIAATSINIVCTGMVIDASTAAPVGVALRGIRFSPVPGTQE